jgi:hypothetical protein
MGIGAYRLLAGPDHTEHHPEGLGGGLRGSVLLPTDVGLIAFAGSK